MDAKGQSIAEGLTKMLEDLQLSSALSGAAISHGVAVDAAAGTAEGRSLGSQINRGDREEAPQREEGR